MLSHFAYDFTTQTATGATEERDLLQKTTDHLRDRTQTYAYDNLNRVTRSDRKVTGGSVFATWTYGYDNAGNRTKKTDPNGTTSYAYDAANQLCWRAAADVTSPACGSPPTGAVSYTHDANGNLTDSSESLQLRYDVANQTKSIKLPSWTWPIEFAYAGEGQKERTRKGDIGFDTTVLGLERETQGTTATRYVHDPKGTLVARRSGGTRHYYLRDQLGSIVALTDASGAVTRTHLYRDPYGESVESSGTTPNPWRFAGEYLDEETGYYKIGERYYDPRLGRWTQADPIHQPADPRNVNAYLYAGQDPVNLADPSGEIPFVAGVLAAGAIRWGITRFVASEARRRVSTTVMRRFGPTLQRVSTWGIDQVMRQASRAPLDYLIRHAPGAVQRVGGWLDKIF